MENKSQKNIVGALKKNELFSLAFLIIFFFAGLGSTVLFAQNVTAPTATVPVTVYLCDTGTQVFGLPDLIISETDVNDFNSGQTNFLITTSALNVSWDLTNTALAFNGTSQSFASAPVVSGADLLITIDLAANTTLETFTISGLQLVFDSGDFLNYDPSFDITIEDPETTNGYSFQQALTAYTLSVQNGALTTGVTEISGESGTYVHCADASLPELTVTGNENVDAGLPASYQWQWQYFNNGQWVDLNNANGASYTPTSLLQDRVYRRETVSFGGCVAFSDPLEIKVNSYLPGSVSFDSGTELTDYYVCADTDISIYDFSPAVADDSSAVISYQWFYEDTIGTQLISGATDPYLILTSPTEYEDGTTFFRRAFASLDGKICNTSGKDSQRLRLLQTVIPDAGAAIGPDGAGRYEGCEGETVVLETDIDPANGLSASYSWEQLQASGAWLPIANGTTYTFDLVQGTATFRRRTTLANSNCSVLSEPIDVIGYRISPGQIRFNSGETALQICEGASLPLVRGVLDAFITPVSNTFSVSYTWEISTFDGTTWSPFTAIVGALDTDLTLGFSVTQRLRIRRRASIDTATLNCFSDSGLSNEITIDVITGLTGGSAGVIGDPTLDYVVCEGEGPLELEISSASQPGSAASYGYQWERRTEGTSDWIPVLTNGTGPTLVLDNLNDSASYRRVTFVVNGQCEVVSDPVNLWYNRYDAGQISWMDNELQDTMTICSDDNLPMPVSLQDGLAQNSGAGLLWLWQYSEDGGATWTPIGVQDSNPIFPDWPANSADLLALRRLAFSQWSIGGRTWECVSEGKASNILYLERKPAVDGGSIDAAALNQSLCNASELPVAITVTDTNDTAVLPLAYQWERYNALNDQWVALLGETGASLVFTPDNRPLVTTRYRRATYLRDANLGNICVSTSENEAEIQVFAIDPGQVAVSDSYVCFGDIATIFNTSAPISVPDQNLTRSWEWTTDSVFTMDPIDVNWTSIAQNQLELQTDPFLDTVETTYYFRRVVNPEFCQELYSNIVTIQVLPEVVSGTTVTQNQDICLGDSPGQLSVAVASPLSGNLSYQWFQRTDLAATFVPVPLAQGATYSPGSLLATTYFYREAYFSQNDVCAATSSVLELRVQDLDPGVITGTQTLCEGATDIALGSVEAATVSYAGTITYQWQQTTTVTNPNSWVNVNEPTANNAVLTLSQVSSTDMHYRRMATVDGLGCSAYSNVATLQFITHVGDAQIQFVGSSGDAFLFCSGTLPLITGVASLQSSAQQISYRWYESDDPSTLNLIPGANSSTYQPTASVGQYRYYKREAVLTTNGVDCILESNVLEVEPGNPNVLVNAGTIFATDASGIRVGSEVVLCEGGIPNTFLGDESQISYNGDPAISIPFTYQWLRSTDGISYTPIPGATGKDYAEQETRSQTTYYSRTTNPSYAEVICAAGSSNIITVLVPEIGSVDISSNSRVICPGDAVQTLMSTRTIPQTELSTMSFQWWQRVGSGTWAPIPGANNETYTPQAPTETTSYKRVATYDVDEDNIPDCAGEIESNEWTIRVNEVNPGRITYNGTMVDASTIEVCYGSQPELLITDGSLPYTVNGTQALFNWQVSPDGSDWTDLDAYDEDFQPPALLQDTWYRREVGSLDSSGLLCWSDASNTNVLRIIVLPEVAVPVLVDNIGVACSNNVSPGFLQIDNYNTDPNLSYIWEQSNNLAVWDEVTDLSGLFGGEVWNVPQLFETTYYRVKVFPTGFPDACLQESNVVEIPVVNLDPGYLKFLNGDTEEHYQASCELINTDILIGSDLGQSPSAPGYEDSYGIFWESRPYGDASGWTAIDFSTITANPLGNTLRIYDNIQDSRYFRRGIRVPTSNGSFCVAYSNPVLVEVMEPPLVAITDTDPYITKILCPGEANGAITLSGTGAVAGGIPDPRQQQVEIHLSGTFDMGDVLTINVNGSAFTVTTATGEVLTDLAAALANEINNGQSTVTATAQQAQIILDASVAGAPFTLGTLVQTRKNIRMDVTYLQASHPGLTYTWTKLANGIPLNGFVDPGTLDLTNVSAGAYQLTVTNLIDCTSQTSPIFNVTEPESLPGNIQIARGNVVCVGEDILLSVTGNSDEANQGYQWEYSLDGTIFNPIEILGVDAQNEELLFPDIQTTTFFRRSQFLTSANGAFCAGGVVTSPPYQIVVLDPIGGAISATEPVVCQGVVPNPIISDPVSPALDGISSYYWESTQDITSASPVWNRVQNAISETLSFNAPLEASTRFRRFSVMEQAGIVCVSQPSTEALIMLENPPTINRAAILANGVLNASCSGAMDGSITLATSDIEFPSNGPDPVTASYRWINLDDPNYVATTVSISNLAPGRYQLELTYNRCTVISDAIAITEPDPLVMDVQASCNGTLATGVSGGSGTYEYTLVHPNGRVESLIASAGQVFPNLIPGGRYTLTVDDLGDRSCPPISADITIPLGLVLDQETIQAQPVSCFGASDGAISMNVGDLTIQGGTAPFEIAWLTPSGATLISENPNQLEAGTYVLTATDQLGCSASTSLSIGAADLLEITQSQVINQELSCAGDEDASIAILIQADPDRSFQIDWYKNNTSYTSNTNEINGLGAGLYGVEVYYLDNANDNCRVRQEFEVSAPEPFNANVVRVQEITCDPSLGGAITITAQGGTLPYRIRLDGGTFQNFNTQEFTLTGVTAGSHQVTVTDSNDCEAADFTVSLSDIDPVAAEHNPETDQQPIKCNQSGSLSVRASGGSPPYFYEWTGPSYAVSGSNFATVDGLSLPGAYSVIVTDANQCQSEALTITLEDLSQGFEVDAVLGDVSCVGPANPTSITLNIGASIVAPYTVRWENWQLLDPTDTSCAVDCYGWVRIPEADGALTYTNALPGNYRIIISDASLGSCGVQERYVTVPEGLLQIINPVLSSPACNVANAQLNFGVKQGSPIQLFLNGNPLDTANTELSYDGVNDRYSLNGLAPGDYTLEAKALSEDTGSCTATYSFRVAAYSPITFTGETNFILDVCETSPLFSLPATNISGGNPFYGPEGAPYYNLEWTGPNNFGMSGVTSIPVGEGEYQVVIGDASGCTSESVVFSFTKDYEPISVTSNLVQPGCGNSGTGAINIQIRGGKPLYDILWEREVIEANGQVFYEELGSAFTSINNLESGRYRLTVLSDLPQCAADNPAKSYIEIFTLGGNESLGLVEGPDLSADLCAGQPGVISLVLFDNSGAIEGGHSFYYNGNLAVSDYKGNGAYEIFLANPVDDALLSMVNTLGCELIEEISIGVPDASFAFNSPSFISSGNLLEQEDITFTNQTVGDFALAVWNFGDGTEVRVDPDTDPTEIIHSYEFSGTYEVSLAIFNDSGCSRIYSESLAVGLGYQILFPNAFTPNGDGINEYFEGEFTGIARFELRIYNVWGGLISSISHENETKPEFWGWDGNYNDGTPYTQKYFRYVFNAQAMSGEEVNQSGEAVILR